MNVFAPPLVPMPENVPEPEYTSFGDLKNCVVSFGLPKELIGFDFKLCL